MYKRKVMELLEKLPDASPIWRSIYTILVIWI